MFDCRTKFLTDDWMMEKKFVDEEESSSDKSAWLVVSCCVIQTVINCRFGVHLVYSTDHRFYNDWSRSQV